jgi:hypothetical protein
MSAVRWLLQAALGIFAAVGPASAQEGNATQVWLNPGAFTHHFKNGDYREDNYGIGAEVFVAPQHGFLAGSFINSNRERSRYAGYRWRPWLWKPAGLDLRPGVVFAMFDGYSNTNNGNWFPAAFPSLSAEHGPFGADLTLIPNPRNGSAIALQLKLQVW